MLILCAESCSGVSAGLNLGAAIQLTTLPVSERWLELGRKLPVRLQTQEA